MNRTKSETNREYTTKHEQSKALTKSKQSTLKVKNETQNNLLSNSKEASSKTPSRSNTRDIITTPRSHSKQKTNTKQYKPDIKAQSKKDRLNGLNKKVAAQKAPVSSPLPIISGDNGTFSGTFVADENTNEMIDADEDTSGTFVADKNTNGTFVANENTNEVNVAKRNANSSFVAETNKTSNTVNGVGIKCTSESKNNIKSNTSNETTLVQSLTPEPSNISFQRTTIGRQKTLEAEKIKRESTQPIESKSKDKSSIRTEEGVRHQREVHSGIEKSDTKTNMKESKIIPSDKNRSNSNHSKRSQLNLAKVNSIPNMKTDGTNKLRTQVKTPNSIINDGDAESFLSRTPNPVDRKTTEPKIEHKYERENEHAPKSQVQHSPEIDHLLIKDKTLIMVTDDDKETENHTTRPLSSESTFLPRLENTKKTTNSELQPLAFDDNENNGTISARSHHLTNNSLLTREDTIILDGSLADLANAKEVGKIETYLSLHLINENNDVTSQSPANIFQTVDTDTFSCKACGMFFKTKYLLNYHKSGLCLDDNTRNHSEDENFSARLPFGMDTHSYVNTHQNNYDRLYNEDSSVKLQKIHWDKGFNGKVPIFAVKIGVNAANGCETFVCRAKLGKEKLPGTIVPDMNCAFVGVGSKEIKVLQYEVLTDPHETLSWKVCDVIGGIPRGAQVGGYDNSNMTCFVARVQTDDGCHCIGRYVPHSRECHYVLAGNENTTTEFEFLCKK